MRLLSLCAVKRTFILVHSRYTHATLKILTPYVLVHNSLRRIYIAASFYLMHSFVSVCIRLLLRVTSYRGTTQQGKLERGAQKGIDQSLIESPPLALFSILYRGHDRRTGQAHESDQKSSKLLQRRTRPAGITGEPLRNCRHASSSPGSKSRSSRPLLDQ